MKKKLLILFMRISIHMLTIAFLVYIGSGIVWAHETDAQQLKDTFIQTKKGTFSLKQVIRKIEQSSDFNFTFYDSHLLATEVVIKGGNFDLESLLEEIARQSGLSFLQVNNNIAIRSNRAKDIDSSVNELINIEGVIRDAKTGEPLPGVNILIKGTTKGTVTDIEGRFKIDAERNETLLVSFIGYESQEIRVGNESFLVITLNEDNKSLDEVVIIGYGTQSKQDVSGSIASLSVTDKRLAELPLMNPEQLMQGRIAGVNVTQNSGTPGGRSTVRIRGASSITGGNDPLYVVDGIPINVGNYNGAAGGAVSQNPLSNISPNEIESIEVLKDAAAAAIYGSRASNGVIIITTKRGSEGRSRVSFNAYTGIQEVSRRIPLMNGPEWGELINEARANVGLAPIFEDPSTLPTTDWQDEIFRRAPIQNYEVSLSGGTQKSQYFLSGGYFDQSGVVIASGFRRGNFRFNFDQHLNDRMKTGVSLSLTRSTQDRVSTSDRQGIVAVAIVKSPAIPVRLEDGSLNPVDPYISNLDNPVIIAEQVRNQAFNNRVIGNGYIDFEIIDGLTLRSTLGVDYLGLEEVLFVPRNNLTVVGRTTNGSGTNSFTQDIGWINENTLSYIKEFSADHRFNALLGYSLQTSEFSRTIASATNFALESIPTLASASIKNSSSTGSSWGLVSYFSRFNYSFKNKLVLAASYRIDGSSRFSENNKYGSFPSVSAAYRLGQEDFLRNLKWLNEFKIRGSWGRTGNQEIGNFTSRGLFAGGFNYIGLSGLAPIQLENPDLTWETTEQTNLGFDFSFLNKRLNVSTDVYLKQTSGLLLDVLLPATSGFNSSLQNVGNVENRGLELAFNSVNIRNNKFSWLSDFNINFNRNKVTNLPGGPRPLGFNGYASIIKEGFPLGTFYGWRIIRVNPETGNFDFEDLDGDGNIPFASTSTDVQVIGSAQPKFTGGLTNTFTLGKFDASVFMHFVYGNQIFDLAEYSYGRLHTWFNSSRKIAENRWRQPGDITTVQRAAWGDPTRNGSVSDRTISDGSFLRIKNVSLGYNHSNPKLEKIGIQGVRLYLAANNLFTFTRYQGYDPEVNGFEDDARFGFDANSYPQARSYIFGLNVTF
ncbi:SusC/RagA family TonB-linked outer membrane protein [Cecembia calidifontis]|uniref:TonB-linked SusC/RagA family outer membrane protein n=1 Tax=Cecembia calidifontis TaxID=1187080 RepID=A0A4Q7PDV6_9BACT|nr:TonB-dependent receptor [Cecembia calidifontis]RZS98287.1 TonB-linked SusC/RagA family outer membrane protein [Cecembia calidifontis]